MERTLPTPSLAELRRRLVERLDALALTVERSEEALRSFSARLDHLRSQQAHG